MSDNTKIEWTEATWTPIRARRAVALPDADPGDLAEARLGWHCEHASEGCRFCYAEGMNKRLGTGLPFKPGHRKDVEIFVDDRLLEQPRRWKRGRMIFVCSMTDLFADFVADSMIDRVVAMMACCPQHRFQVLTKRPERMRAYFEALPTRQSDLACDSGLDFVEFPLPNVWLGTSVEDQRAADERIPQLLATPAAVRFLSCEPLLGPVDLTSIKAPREHDEPAEDLEIDWRFDGLTTGDFYWFDGENGQPGDCGDGPHRDNRIDWVIAGGESGPNARAMHPDWVRGLRDQCAEATINGDPVPVPFFFKQWGEYVPVFDRDIDDPDWRDCDKWQYNHPRGRWLNLAGGCGFHGERVIYVDRPGKRAAGRLLDGVEHSGMPA
jgi:protein gp37